MTPFDPGPFGFHSIQRWLDEHHADWQKNRAPVEFPIDPEYPPTVRFLEEQPGPEFILQRLKSGELIHLPGKPRYKEIAYPISSNPWRPPNGEKKRLAPPWSPTAEERETLANINRLMSGWIEEELMIEVWGLPITTIPRSSDLEHPEDFRAMLETVKAEIQNIERRLALWYKLAQWPEELEAFRQECEENLIDRVTFSSVYSDVLPRADKPHWHIYPPGKIAHFFYPAP